MTMRLTPAFAIFGISFLSPAMLEPAVRSSRICTAKMSGFRGVVTTAGFGAHRTWKRARTVSASPSPPLTASKVLLDGMKSPLFLLVVRGNLEIGLAEVGRSELQDLDPVSQRWLSGPFFGGLFLQYFLG